MSLTHSGSCCRSATTLLRGIRSSGRHALFKPSFGLCWPLHHCYIVVTGNFRGIDAEFCSDNRSHLTLRSTIGAAAKLTVKGDRFQKAEDCTPAPPVQ
jgi:hypothetical protein